MLLADEHAEKALVLEELPELRRQVGAVGADVPVVDHAAGFFGRAVQKRLLFRRQRQRPDGVELVPVRAPGEQFSVPADRAGIERLLLGLADPGQDRLHGPVDRRQQHRPADCGDAEQQQDDARQQRQEQPEATMERQAAVNIEPAQQPEHQRGDTPLPQWAFAHGKHAKDDETDDEKRESHEAVLLVPAAARAAQIPWPARRWFRLEDRTDRAGIIARPALTVDPQFSALYVNVNQEP